MVAAHDQGFCMSVGDELLFLHNAYDPDQLWLPFVRAIYPKAVENVDEPAPKVHNRHIGWHVTPDAQYALPFIEGKRVTKNHRRRLHQQKFPTYDRRSNGSLLELRLIGEPNAGRKSRVGRNVQLRKNANEWCLKNLRGQFIPDRYYVFELAEDYALALLDGKYFMEVETVTRVC